MVWEERKEIWTNCVGLIYGFTSLPLSVLLDNIFCKKMDKEVLHFLSKALPLKINFQSSKEGVLSNKHVFYNNLKSEIQTQNMRHENTEFELNAWKYLCIHDYENTSEYQIHLHPLKYLCMSMTANKKLFCRLCQRLTALRQLTQMDRVRSGEALMVDEGSFLSVVKNRKKKTNLIFSMDCFCPVKLEKNDDGQLYLCLLKS